MEMDSIEIASAIGGTHRGENVPVSRFSIDSRDIERGSMFVPILRERDGHAFIQDAVDRGAVAYLTNSMHLDSVASATSIEVEDPELSLIHLAEYVRARLKADVVAITGSVGKTSVKDLTKSMLSKAFDVVASPRSYNAELGVALTLVNTPRDTDVLVLEMGARGPGQIAELCRVAKPITGVVTSVAASHLEGFGSIETIRATKAELVESLPADGRCVLNFDDANVVRMRASTQATAVTYSASGNSGADITATDVSIDDELRTHFRLSSSWGSGDIALGLHGLHNVENALGAAGAALVTGASFEDVTAALEEARPSPNRMELADRSDGLKVINDTYNANPKSTEAALRALARVSGRRHVAVLGVMAELGKESATWHRYIADLSKELGVVLIPVGTGEYGVAGVSTHEEALAALDELGLGGDDVVLVKGSRVAQLDRLVTMILE